MIIIGGIAIALTMFILATVAAWITGMFNPMGYFGVLPWRVPPCTCGIGNGLGHATTCPRGPEDRRRV